MSQTKSDELPLVFSYTRAQAIADGVLVDTTADASKVGIKYPVALTAGVHAKLFVGKGSENPACYRARLLDVLGLFAFKARVTKGDELHYQVRVGRELLRLWAKVGPGDTPDPVITIMLEGED